MAFTEAAPAPEQTGEIPSLKLDLKDVPETSPEAFNDALVANVQAAVKRFVDYLNANRKAAIGKHFMFQFLRDHNDPASAEIALRAELNGQVDKFIFDLQNFSRVLTPILRAYGHKPIEQQRTLTLPTFNLFYIEVARHRGVMQSFIPFDLEAGYDAIHKRIRVPLVGFDFDTANRPVYKPAPRVSEVDPEHDNAAARLAADLTAMGVN